MVGVHQVIEYFYDGVQTALNTIDYDKFTGMKDGSPLRSRCGLLTMLFIRYVSPITSELAAEAALKLALDIVQIVTGVFLYALFEVGE